MASSGTPVFANVYNLVPSDSSATKLSNDALAYVKMGVFHVGIEVLGCEWSFGLAADSAHDPNVDGIFSVAPRRAVGEFKEQIALGTVNPPLTPERVKQVLDALRPQWKAATYHLLTRNCCYFSRAFAAALNPDFENTFPHYTYRAAGVGDKVLPDALVSSLTAALAPPPATPPHLIGKIDVPWTGAIPPPKIVAGAAAPAAAASSGGALGGLMGFAKSAAASVGEKVKSVTDDRERTALAKAFPSLNVASLIGSFDAHVQHIFREQNATIFVLDKCLAISGENGLAVNIAYENIQSVTFGRRTKPSTRGLQPSFTVEDTNIGGADAAVFVFLKTGLLIPIYDFAAFGSKLSDGFAKLMPGGTVSANPNLNKFMDVFQTVWLSVARR